MSLFQVFFWWARSSARLERVTDNDEVDGSNPSAPTKRMFDKLTPYGGQVMTRSEVRSLSCPPKHKCPF